MLGTVCLPWEHIALKCQKNTGVGAKGDIFSQPNKHMLHHEISEWDMHRLSLACSPSPYPPVISTVRKRVPALNTTTDQTLMNPSGHLQYAHKPSCPAL